uniref:cullin-RING-type E3 NEDD8 transferase n=1 Tax=Chrysemys picta bellii TaxID=8478 RepID=A0A8C3F9V7_CHRPI
QHGKGAGPGLGGGLGGGGSGGGRSGGWGMGGELYSEHQIEFCSCLLLDACLRCQAENKQEDCVVVWGECNHSFHNCCMSLWVKQNNRCPLCQQDWVVQRIGK